MGSRVLRGGLKLEIPPASSFLVLAFQACAIAVGLCGARHQAQRPVSQQLSGTPVLVGGFW